MRDRRTLAVHCGFVVALCGLLPPLLAGCSEERSSNGVPSEGIEEASQALNCQTIQRAGGASAVSDATIASDPTDPSKQATNFGGVLTLQTGLQGSTAFSSLMRFDLGSIPASANITSATLNLRKAQSPGSGIVTLRRITAPWVEGTVTWSSFADAFDSASSLGSFDPNAYGNGTTVQLDVLSAVQSWHAGTTQNHGFYLQQVTGKTVLGASEGPAIARPTLSVCFVPTTCSNGVQDGTELGVDCGGLCAPCANPCAGVVCTASDACHVVGSCDPLTGQCSNPAAPDGTSCNDGDACTQSDSCQAGACTGSSPVVCTPPDACLGSGTCDPQTGQCSFLPVACCSDGAQNQGETGIDCGGPCAPCAATCPSCVNLLVAQGAGSAGSLYEIDLSTLSITPVGALPVGLTGMATAPDGTIYGVTSTWNYEGELVIIDPTTAAVGTVALTVDSLWGFDYSAIPDITFVGETLVGMTSFHGIGIIDRTTGLMTITGGTAFPYGAGMAAGSDGVIYFAPEGDDGDLYTLNGLGGQTVVTPLDGNLGVIRAMTFSNGVLYGVASDWGVVDNLVAIDPQSGHVTTLMPLPNGIDAMTTVGYAGEPPGSCADGIKNQLEQGVDCGGPCVAPCACVVDQAFTGLAVGSTLGTHDLYAGSCGGDYANEATFSFVAPLAGVYTFDTFGSSFDTVLYARDGGCDGPEITCNDDTGGSASQISLTLAAGQSVVIFVDSRWGRGDYILHLTTADPCTDGLAAGDETDIDCGGETCAPCATGQMCVASSDCVTGSCDNGVCGMSGTASIAGSVWFDSDQDGSVDAGEGPVAGLLIAIDSDVDCNGVGDISLDATSADGLGTFLLEGLLDGCYVLSALTPGTYTVTTGNDPYPLSLGVGQTLSGLVFGVWAPPNGPLPAVSTAMPQAIAQQLPTTPEGLPILLTVDDPATGVKVDLVYDEALDDPISRMGQCLSLVLSCYDTNPGQPIAPCVGMVPLCADDAGGVGCCPPGCVAQFQSLVGAGSSELAAMDASFINGSCLSGFAAQVAAASSQVGAP